MKLWLKVFLLSSVTSLAAILVMGVLNLGSGYDALLQGASQSLLRDKGNITAAIEREWRTARALSLAFPGNELIPPESVSSLQAYIKNFAAEILDPETQVEIRAADGSVLFVSGNLFPDTMVGTRAELDAAGLGGTTYVSRKVSGVLALFLSAPARLGNTDLLVSTAIPLGTLDAYWKRQVFSMAAGCAAAVLLLLAAAYAGSRAIARRLEKLSARTEAIASGDYGGTIVEKGKDEIAELTAHINGMARQVDATFRRLRLEKEDRQRFVDSLTHEMRTPLTSIVGFADLLRLRTRDEAVQAECVERIRAEGAGMLALMESLKRLLIARGSERDFSPIEVGPFLRYAIKDMEAKCAAWGVSLLVEAGPGRLHADPDLLATAIVNLVENAAAASPPGGSITVGFSTEGAPTLFVRDQGPGMSDEELSRAGEPFFRGAGPKGKDGFGLGLMICKEIAVRHGAELVLERVPGGGLMAKIVFLSLQGIYTPEQPS